MAVQPSPEALLYLWTCPGTAEYGYVTGDEFGKYIGMTKTLPENIRRLLVSEDSALKIRKLAIGKHQLSLEQTQNIARIMGQILRGQESAVRLRPLLGQHVEAPPPLLDDLAQTLTKEFITPNYFQIAQVYEKKHPKIIGSWQPANGVPPRVVDLRNGAIPSRLPPSPPPTPRSPRDEVGPVPRSLGEVGPTPKPPPPPPPPPQSEPTPPPPLRNGGPSADDLLHKLGRPGGGTHGPLPPPA